MLALKRDVSVLPVEVDGFPFVANIIFRHVGKGEPFGTGTKPSDGAGITLLVYPPLT